MTERALILRSWQTSSGFRARVRLPNKREVEILCPRLLSEGSWVDVEGAGALWEVADKTPGGAQ